MRGWQSIDRRYRDLALAMLVGMGYWALAKYSFALPVRSSGISYVWPADGLALGALLCSHPRSWPYYLVAVFLGNALASNKPAALNLLYSSFNVFEPWLVAFVVTKMIGVRRRTASMASAFGFLVLTTAVMAVAIFITAAIDAAIHRGDFWIIWQVWYLSNTVGMLIFAPLLVAMTRDLPVEFERAPPKRFVEAAALVAGLAISTYFTFSPPLALSPGFSAAPMLAPALFMVWGAIRFALPGGTLTLAIFSLMAFWYTAHGVGPVAEKNTALQIALLHLQLSLVVVAIAVILVSAVATEWRNALAESRATRAKLDRALESARLALFEIDAASGAVYLSEGWAEMIGAGHTETRTTLRELMELVDPEDRDAVWEIGLEAMSGDAACYDVQHRVRRADGTHIWVLTRGGVVERGGGGRALRFAGTIMDINERKLADQRLHYLATRDSLTGLPNRALFHDTLQQALDQAARWRDRLAVISLGLDRFTSINDSLGQQAGDLVLKEIAARLRSLATANMTVARPGGDEFLALVPVVHSREEILATAENIRKVISQPIRLDNKTLVVTASIGVAIAPEDADSPDSLTGNADIAMHSAKTAGRNAVHAFSRTMNAAAAGRLEAESALRRALERDQFLVHYQPQVDLMTGALIGYEALARWQHPKRGLVSPKDFVPIADSLGLLVPLGNQLLAKACADAARWQRHAACRVAVNAAVSQLRDPGFLETIEATLAASKLDPRMLEIEITEDSLVDHGAGNIATVLQELGAMGVQLAVDDFGTGYSSLAYLKRLPIDTVKIDRSFVIDLPNDAETGAIVGAIIALAHNLGLKVLAEGVETEAQAHYLRDHGCDLAQGYLFGRPQPYEALAARWEPSTAQQA